MNVTNMKKLLTTLALLTCALPAFAQIPIAKSFAREAGAVAGVAKACGVDVYLFEQRSNEAVVALAANQGEAYAAMADFHQNLKIGLQDQAGNHLFDCNKVTQDFNGLPIMSSNYRETVIAKLKASAPPPAGTPSAQMPNQISALTNVPAQQFVQAQNPTPAPAPQAQRTTPATQATQESLQVAGATAALLNK